MLSQPLKTFPAKYDDSPVYTGTQGLLGNKNADQIAKKRAITLFLGPELG